MNYSSSRQSKLKTTKQSFLKFLVWLEADIRGVINIFVRTGSVNKEKSRGRSSLSEEVVDDLRRLEQNPQSSLTKFPQQSGLSVAT